MERQAWSSTKLNQRPVFLLSNVYMRVDAAQRFCDKGPSCGSGVSNQSMPELRASAAGTVRLDLSPMDGAEGGFAVKLTPIQA